MYLLSDPIWYSIKVMIPEPEECAESTYQIELALEELVTCLLAIFHFGIHIDASFTIKLLTYQ